MSQFDHRFEKEKKWVRGNAINLCNGKKKKEYRRPKKQKKDLKKMLSGQGGRNDETTLPLQEGGRQNVIQWERSGPYRL